VKVAIIDYGSGNLHSAAKAFERAARDNAIAAEIAVTSDVDDIARADRIVLPGVGAFRDCREGVAPFRETLDEQVIARGKPFLGICVGMQLMASFGHEHETVGGLGWISGDVRMIAPKDASLKVPHMGWNTLELSRAHPLFKDVALGENGLHAYFVHSYHLEPAQEQDAIATTNYGGTVFAAVARDNYAGVQFHPEKSQALGLALIANFLRWKP
jgi:imidazole glycerol-phosphate synthase subunit HisH